MLFPQAALRHPERGGAGAWPKSALEEHDGRLEEQQKSCKWHRFVNKNLILKQGLLDKRKVGFLRIAGGSIN